jgi:integrase
VRAVLDGLTVRLDGKPAAASVVSRRRKIFNTAIEFAVERGFLAGNPLPALKWHARKAVHAVDRRSVANPAQARTLLAAVGEGPAGKRLVAFYGCLYFAALRPEEAVGLREVDLDISVEG